MLRKLIVALVLCLGFLLIVSNLVMASEPNRPAYQMDMGTPTTVPQAISTPVLELPLQGSTAQTGTCPMMGGAGMTGTGMQGMPMGDMTGMNMGSMGMGGMQGMNMSGMNMAGIAMTPAPWYSNPWWLLGWVLLTLVVIAILVGAVFGVIWLARSNRSLPPTAV